MICHTVTVQNRLGLHARPAALLTKTANLFECKITLETDQKKTADAKSILAVMTLAAKFGSSVTITCDGINELAASDALCALFESRFGEEE